MKHKVGSVPLWLAYMACGGLATMAALTSSHAFAAKVPVVLQGVQSLCCTQCRDKVRLQRRVQTSGRAGSPVPFRYMGDAEESEGLL